MSLMAWLLICCYKNIESIATALYICGIKLNISLAFITQSQFVVAQNTRLNELLFYASSL